MTGPDARRTHPFTRSLIGVLAAMTLVLAACGDATPTTDGQPPSGNAVAPASLRVALDWFANPDHVALYYALDHGSFDARNLAVDLAVPSDVSAGLKLVATGRFDLSIYYEGELFFAAEQGLPVIAVGSLVPRPLNSVMALASSSVRDAASLEGATVGISGLPLDDAILATIADRQGFARGDLSAVNVGYDLVPALLSEQVDAVLGTYFNIEGIHVESRTGTAPIVITMDELGVPHYDELIVVANRDRLRDEPAYADAVRRFLAALVEATDAARADEAGAIATMEANSEYSDAEIEAMVADTLPLLASPLGLRTGCFDLDGWTTFGRWMLDNRLLETPVDVTTIVTNDYLPAC